MLQSHIREKNSVKNPSTDLNFNITSMNFTISYSVFHLPLVSYFNQHQTANQKAGRLLYLVFSHSSIFYIWCEIKWFYNGFSWHTMNVTIVTSLKAPACVYKKLTRGIFHGIALETIV